MKRERYALLSDESGNSEDQVLVLSGVSGPVKELLGLERRLRAALARQGLKEIKFTQIRSKPRRLRAAEEFLSLAAQAAVEGDLALDLLVLEKGPATKAWSGLKPGERWHGLYRALVLRARKRWRGGLWLFPDQRTGMRWKKLLRESGLKSVKESSSSRLALIQLADLMAGLLRFTRLSRAGSAPRARENREGILSQLLEFSRLGKLGLRLDSKGRLASDSKARAMRIWEIKKLEGV